METVVDRDSGCAFGESLSGKKRDELSGYPFHSSPSLFPKDLGIAAVKEIHTRKTPEYCGLVPMHPYGNFSDDLSHPALILSTNQLGKPYSYPCVQFYRHLQKEFFQPALHARTFMLTLDELQTDLDAFMETFNAMQWKRVS